MRVSGIRRHLPLVLLSLVVGVSPLTAQDQGPRPGDAQKRIVHITSKPYEKWLDEDVRWIITDQERSDFLNLTTDAQRDKFVEDFWNRRNPTPGSSENPFKEEHYRRIGYANTHFAAHVPGWKTDRGRSYIMYGPPDSVDAKTGLALPTETWHYVFIEGLGRNVVLSFTDKCVCGEYPLSEADSDSRIPNPRNPISSVRAQDQTPAPRSPRGWLDPTVSEEYKKWLREDVGWIISDEERADFKKLAGDKQRDDFVVAFWERRNPTPGATPNAYKEEHYRRLAYANQHFAAGIPGWKTDRGRIYIMFGPPDSVEHHPAAASSDKPQQPSGNDAANLDRDVWRYKYIEGVGKNVTIEFVDTCRCGDYRMKIDQY